MKTYRHDILLLIALIVLGFAFLTRECSLPCSIEPIARIVWLIYRTLLSIDQEIYWNLLILAALSLAVRMIPKHLESSIHSAYRSTVQEDDRVRYWQALLKSAEVQKSDLLLLQRNLATLQSAINAQSTGNEEGVRMPPFKIGFQQRIQVVWKLLPFSKMSQRKGGDRATDLEKYVDTILQKMEAQLEINDG